MSDDVITETWAYAGRRHDSTGKQWYAWERPDDQPGDLGYFGKLKATVVGGIYEVRLNSDRTSAYLGPLYTGDQVESEALRLQWQAEDQVSRERENRQRAERSAARNTDLDQLLAPLEAMMKSLPNRHSAGAFARLVSDRLVDAYYR